MRHTRGVIMFETTDRDFRFEVARYAIDQVGPETTDWVELADLLVAFADDEIEWEEDEEEDGE